VNKKLLPVLALRLLQQERQLSLHHGPIAVAGAKELVPLLAEELRAGGDAAAVVEGVPNGHAAALVWIGEADPESLRRAARAGTPIVGLTDGASLPYVLDTNLVPVSPGRGLPVEATAAALARVLGAAAPSLAARLPVLRGAVVARLVRVNARRNGVIGAAGFLPGFDLRALTLNQLYMTIRMTAATGRNAELAALWPELAAVVASGFAWRTVARRLELLPVPRAAVRGVVAFAGTWALGEALRLRLRSRASVRQRS
jgi:hypothetical protein